MSFKEDLKKISDKAIFELDVAEECANIKDGMKDTAKQGIRTFQIECILIKHGCVVAFGNSDICNYYRVQCKNGFCINDYVQKTVQFLLQQGFERKDIEFANMVNDTYSSVLLNVRW